MNPNMKLIAGIVILVVGMVLLGFAFNASNSPIERLSDTLTGRYSNQTMWYFVSGVAAAVGGGLLVMLQYRK